MNITCFSGQTVSKARKMLDIKFLRYAAPLSSSCVDLVQQKEPAPCASGGGSWA